jgi:hypothetical protein
VVDLPESARGGGEEVVRKGLARDGKNGGTPCARDGGRGAPLPYGQAEGGPRHERSGAQYPLCPRRPAKHAAHSAGGSARCRRGGNPKSAPRAARTDVADHHQVDVLLLLAHFDLRSARMGRGEPGREGVSAGRKGGAEKACGPAAGHEANRIESTPRDTAPHAARRGWRPRANGARCPRARETKGAHARAARATRWGGRAVARRVPSRGKSGAAADGRTACAAGAGRAAARSPIR